MKEIEARVRLGENILGDQHAWRASHFLFDVQSSSKRRRRLHEIKVHLFGSHGGRLYEKSKCNKVNLGTTLIWPWVDAHVHSFEIPFCKLCLRYAAKLAKVDTQ